MTLPFFHHLRNEIKKEMKIKIFRHKFEENDLIQFSAKDLQEAKWINAEEMIHNDTMYDLVKIKISGNRKIYFFLEDHGEAKVKKYQTEIASIFQFQSHKNPTFTAPAHKFSSSQNNFLFSKIIFFTPKFFEKSLKSNFRTPRDYSLNLIFCRDIPPEIYC